MFLKLLSTLGKSNLTKKSARNVSLLVYYYKHESPSRLDFLSFPNNRQCNVTIKIFQRVRANKYEPFNWSIETLHDVVCDMRYQMLDYFLRLSLFFFFPPSNTDDLRMSDDERISSSFETRAQTRRFDFLMQLFPFVLFWLIIFTNSAQLLTDLNRLRQTGCANVSWICVPLRTGSKLRDTDDVKSFEPNAPAMSSV